MADAGFFRGTSAEQDNRFSDKEKKLLKQMKFAENLTTKVEMSKVKLEVMKPWISKRISELLGMEDDVVAEFVINQLEAEKNPDARKIQINLTGFLNGKNARIFMGELWTMLISAQESPAGIPASLVEAKKEEIRKRNDEQDKMEIIKRTVSRYTDQWKQEKQSPPPATNRERSSSRDRDAKNTKGQGGEAEGPKSRDELGAQSKRNYRSRRSASASPEPSSKRKSRSRSGSRERRDRRPMRPGGDRDRRGPDRSRDYRDRQRPYRRSRSRSPPRRPRSRSRSPYRGGGGGGGRAPSPRPVRRRSPLYESRSNRNDTNYRDAPVRRNSSADRDRFRNRQHQRRSRSPITTAPSEDRKTDDAYINNKTSKGDPTPAVEVVQPVETPSSKDSSSSSPENGQPPPSKRKRSSGDESEKSDDEDSKKQKKEKKKKKDKKKRKKQKKVKKVKGDHKSSSEGEDNEKDVEDKTHSVTRQGNGETQESVVLPSEKIAQSFRELVQSDAPSTEDLERKLREKALESMKKSMK